MRLAFAFLPILTSVCVAAAESPTGDNPASDGSTVVVVTATRTEQPIQRVGDSITVIDTAAVRESQKTAVSDLLATTPGVTLARNGGFGATTTLSIRGAEPDQTVVLIDGVRLNDPSSTGGGYNFGNLLTDEVSRIEVLRGPQSTLWGSQAIGGVVNLVTPDPRGPLATSAMMEGGTQDTGQVRLNAQAGDERLGWRLGGGYLYTEGVPAFDERLGGKRRDGYRQLSANGRLRFTLTDGISLDLRSTFHRGRLDFDGFPPPNFTLADTLQYGWTRESVSYLGINVSSFDGRWKNRFAYTFTDTSRIDFDPTVVPSETDAQTGRSGRWEYQGTVEVAKGYEAVYGLESEHSEINTYSAPSAFDPSPVQLANDVRLNSGYAQLQATPIPTLTLTGGVRHDNHETFGGKTTGRAALAWSAIGQDTILRSSFGDGFKAPTLYQLFSSYGNRSLQPESAQGWDAGLEQHAFSGALVMSATYFHRNTRNLIQFVDCFGITTPLCATRPFGFYDNVQRTTARGVEVVMATKIGERLGITANYTHTDAKDVGANDPYFGLQLPRRPRDAAHAEVKYRWPLGIETAVAVQRVSQSFDDPTNLIELAGYTLVDVRASRKFSDRLEIFGRVENVFGASYETTAGYGSIGTGVFVGLRTAY